MTLRHITKIFIFALRFGQGTIPQGTWFSGVLQALRLYDTGSGIFNREFCGYFWHGFWYSFSIIFPDNLP